MATYECKKCGMSVNASCAKCNEPLIALSQAGHLFLLYPYLFPKRFGYFYLPNIHLGEVVYIVFQLGVLGVHL